ncbi:hypothetical protein [Streptomyces flavidovirens]|uniref:hypothetical protein n=1 Tax=Streptomyces flavidovirens TaxID=67298 RepID=UPI0036B76070
MTTTPKPKLLKSFGRVMEEANVDERTAMLSGMPAPARPAWFLVGRPLYARTIRSLRATG